MRFVLATSLLGWSLSLPPESHAFREEIWEWETLQVDKSNLDNKFKDTSLRERMFHANRRIGRNSWRRLQTMEKQECDPSLSDADIGILSCGYNEYCVRSDNSKLGGHCVPAIIHDHLRRLEETNEEDDSTAANETYTAVFDEGMKFCELSYCTCANVNKEKQTLSISCALEENCYESVSRCGVNVSDCFIYTSEMEMVDPHSYSDFRCFNATGLGDGGESFVCYYHKAVNFTRVECAVSLNGEACASCEVQSTFYEYCGEPTSCYNLTLECSYFDCTNIQGGWKGNDCERNPPSIQEYGCVECSLCDPSEVVSFPDATLVSVSRSAENDTRCGDGPILNDVTLAECAELKLKAEDVCGCVPQSDGGGEETIVPTQKPGDTTVPPTEKPSGTIALTSPCSIVVMTTLVLALHVLVLYG
ncbi:hypothetical protein IV203_004027 [Nitzschia inconspicua]|uniref:Uncharacterized protein n=1 Tax=Nitzschia inconspicua TaxID=303405 RepID=A0A9K3PPR6_9STRA|nr:hypothetical protein IV203_004027 [Nitzschia inconspicua]